MVPGMTERERGAAELRRGQWLWEADAVARLGSARAAPRGFAISTAAAKVIRTVMGGLRGWPRRLPAAPIGVVADSRDARV